MIGSHGTGGENLTPALMGTRLKGEELRRMAAKLNLLDSDHRIQSENAVIWIPMARDPSAAELDSLQQIDPNARIQQLKLPENPILAPRSLAEALATQLLPTQLASLPRTFDVIGDLLILEIPEDLAELEEVIAEAALKVYPRVKGVWSKDGPVSGEYRTREHRRLAGEGRSTTIHKENGCLFRVDLQRVFFSPRLAYERQRVTSVVGKDESVVDMFSGVGPFAIQIAKTCRARVYAVEKNPYAFQLLCQNIELNKTENLVTPLHGDAGQLAFNRLKGVGDRIIMNLLEKSHEFITAASSILKSSGGVIHFYTHATDPEPLNAAAKKLENKLKQTGRQSVIRYRRIVKAVAPHEYLVVIDASVA